MSRAPDPLQGLKDALRLTPGNVPLRLHLARSLVGANQAEEAEKLLKEGLEAAPKDEALLLELARVYQRQAKYSIAFVIVEDLIARSATPGEAYVLHARLLQASGQLERAGREYRKALQLDPALADRELEGELFKADSSVEEGPGDDVDPEVVDGRVRARAQADGPAGQKLGLQRPTISFADVGGMEPLKEQVRLKIIHPLTQPDIYKAYGMAIGGGILMYGPPGCGKTYLARATAGEVKASFLQVGINDVLDMWIGNSEKNLHGLFQVARSNTPCVLFFDEVDALGASRRDMRSHGGRHVINQFLAELDGVGSSNEGVLVLAATNAPWHLDPAFRRPGRFDRIIFVPPPDEPARAAVLQVLLRGKPSAGIDYPALAKKTKGFSGADLKAVVDRAVEAKVQQALKKGVPEPLGQKDLLAAASTVKPSIKEWFATARNYALYSNEGGVYDDLLPFLDG